MFTLTLSEVNFLLDLMREAANTDDVPEEIKEGIEILEAILENEQIEVEDIDGTGLPE